MNKSIDAARIADIWLQAWQIRCCPPDTVLADELSDDLRRHLEICPICSRERAEALPPIQLNLTGEEAVAKQQPQPGELWSLQPSQGGWGPKKRYYNPPVVLITALVEMNAVKVFQTFGNTGLAGPDDLILDNNLAGFAQPWNQYTLQTAALHTCLGRISTQLSNHIRQFPEPPAAVPEPGSLLWFFRQMEVETGWYFAEQSLSVLLDKADETPLPALPDIPADQLLADLHLLPVIVPDLTPGALPEDILAGTMPADDLYPLAAADLKPQEIQILLFIVEQGKVQTAEMISADVTLMDRLESTLHVSGCCRTNVPDDAVWIFRWQSGSTSSKPLPGQYGASEGVFWAVFPLTDIQKTEQGELIVRILVHR